MNKLTRKVMQSLRPISYGARKAIFFVLVALVLLPGAFAYAQSAPSVNLNSPKTDLPYGYSTDLFWTSPRATACVATGGANGWAGSKYHGGGAFYTGKLFETTTFTLTCTNSYGSATDSVTVYVAGGPVSYPTVSINASNTNVPYNGSATISWYTSNANSCEGTGGANGWSGFKSIPNGSFNTGALTYTATYTLTCTNGTSSDTKSVTINVANQQYSNPSVSTSGATNVGQSSATLNGYVNSNNSTNVLAWFEWGPNGNFYNQTSKVSYGSTSGTSYNYSLGGLAQNTTYSYRAAAQGQNGQVVYGNSVNFTTTTGNSCNYYNCSGTQAPSVTTYSATNLGESYATLNAYVDPAGTYTTRWFEYGTSSGNLYYTTSKLGQGTSAGNFNQYISGLSNNTTYYFRAVAENSYGTRYGNVLTFTTSNGSIYYGNNCSSYSSCVPGAVTTIATNIDHNSARLNGLGLVYGNVSTNGYFQWGTSTALGNNTNQGFIGTSSSSPFYSSLFDLAPNTTYYFRAVVQNQYGTQYGDIKSFTTGSAPVTTTTTTNIIYRDVVRNVVTNVVDQTAGNTAKPSLVFLTISHNDETVRKGSVIDYVVSYKNVSTKNLKNVVLTVAFPKELQVVDYTRGYFSEENNTVVVNIGDLYPEQEGSVTVNATLVNTANVGEVIVVTANLAYTVAADGTQEEVFAYSKNTVGEGLALAGNALFTGSFLPTTLIGWLLFILLILIVLLILRNLFMSTTRGRSMEAGASGASKNAL